MGPARELALAGGIALAFGLGALRGTGELGVFGALNLGAGAVAIALAAILAWRGWNQRRGGAGADLLRDSLLGMLSVLWAAVLVQQAAAWSGARLDLTFERRYELAPATVAALQSLGAEVQATVYADENDPRVRRTRLLLDEIARHGPMVVRERTLSKAPEEEERFAIRSSNTVVLETRGRWERVDRPTEGALFEALSYLGVQEQRVLYTTAGAGEGDVTELGPVGFSGLAAALETEGYQLRQIDTVALDSLPSDADGVLLLAPRRRLHPSAVAALGRYLSGGGSLVAMLEPGHESGIEELLAQWGFRSPDAIVVDPESDAFVRGGGGTNLIVSAYAGDHPITEGLGRNRRTFFKGARSFELHKPHPEDRLRALVFSSGDAWLVPATPPPAGGGLRRPAGARADYQPLVVAGRFERGGAETRIVVLGDSELANNATLRTLYNLDLVLNAVHWALRREPAISLRPKAGNLIQFPVPIQNSLKAFYGVGLLVPELMLLAAALVWLRRRSL